MFSSAWPAALLSTSSYTMLYDRYHDLHDSIKGQPVHPESHIHITTHSSQIQGFARTVRYRTSFEVLKKLARQTFVGKDQRGGPSGDHAGTFSMYLLVYSLFPQLSQPLLHAKSQQTGIFQFSFFKLYSVFQLCLCNYMAEQIFSTECKICFRQNFQRLTLPNLVYAKGVKVPTQPFFILPLCHQNQTTFPSVSSTCKIYSVLNK